MAITLKQLRYFVALAEARHFGRAAESVHVSQPALSVQIRELEAGLGGPLVERGTQGVVTTPFGREALGHARRVLAAVEDLEQAARWRGGLAGRLRLGMIPTVAPFLLPEALARLRARDLTLEVQVEEAPTADLLTALAHGTIDAAVLALPADLSGLVELPLFRETFLLAGSAEAVARFAALPPLRPEKIPADQLLLLGEGHCLTDQALAACRIAPEARRVDMSASSLSTLTGLAAAGFGVTLLPEIAIPRIAASTPDLVTCPFADDPPGRTIGLVRRAGAGGDDGWFAELATHLASAGEAVLARAALDNRGRGVYVQDQAMGGT
ncbi:LysR family transcriptional regulator [Rhodobacterales bacterium HKCCE2091]|nr:LysR family transcriptional regulator [Rhodobacterales bacterium HKCCE2091]